jgi:flagellar hook-associated protein 2
VDGGAVKESQSNVVKDAIAGVQLTLKGVTGGAAAITVGAPGMDAAKVKEKVTAFVDAYNDLIKTSRGFLDEKRIPNVESAEDATAGVLFGDTGLSSMLTRMRTMVGGTVAGNPTAMDELRELGISTGSATGGTARADSKTGLLTIDDDQLTKALQDPQAVRKMLGGITGTDGFAQQMEGLIKTYTGATGTLTGRISQGDSQMKSLTDQMTAEDTRLSARETRLKTQFSAMESALAAAQAQGSWLSAQLANL